jgi:hypothetical protein
MNLKVILLLAEANKDVTKKKTKAIYQRSVGTFESERHKEGGGG